MLECIILWLYMFVVCLAAGVQALSLSSRLLHTPKASALGTAFTVMAGITALTVYAEIFSIFHGVKLGAHLLMLAVIAALLLANKGVRLETKKVLQRFHAVFFSRECFVILLTAVVIAYFSSRGDFHADTKIYHAQAIRLIEEYGCIRGLGNIQLHFAYNSSALTFAALFSFSSVLSSPFHGTTGFIMLVLSLYSLHGILNVHKTQQRRCMVIQVSIILYVLTNLYYAMSPATDYFSQLFVLFILAGWNTDDVENRTEYYGLLSVLAVFTASLKLSCAALVILALCPLVRLIREHKIKAIAGFILAGFLVILPFLVRNVILSGWLVYPAASIDLFNVDWKIPKAYLLNDAAQIEVWGKCLYDVTKQDYTLSQWFPIWFDAQQHYEVMLFYAQFIATAGLILCFIWRRINRRKPDFARAMYYIAVYFSLAVWFFSAPFIRYGLAFLLSLPGSVMADLFMESKYLSPGEKKHPAFFSLPFTAGLVCTAAITFCSVSWIDNYGMNDLVFIKHHLSDPYYVWQKDYDHPQEETLDMGNGVTVYVSTDSDENNSYWVTPSTCYSFMAERSMARGSRIEDGFKAREANP